MSANQLDNIPRDQYSCTECSAVPEIKNVDFTKGTISFKCPVHGDKNDIKIDDYFYKELEHIYYNFKCKDGKLNQWENMNDIFSYCTQCETTYCKKCSREHNGRMHKDSLIKVNELNTKCKFHFQKFEKYCPICKEHYCNECRVCGHRNNIKEIMESSKYLQTLKESKDKLEDKKKYIEDSKKVFQEMKKKLDKLAENLVMEEKIIKLLDTLIQTYEKHPSNYYHSINLKNVAEINYDFNYEKLNFNEITLDKEGIIKKLNDLELKVEDIISKKYNINCNSEDINLERKGINDLELKLISCGKYPNAKNINLSHNDITDVKNILSLYAPKAKKFDLSYNGINNIKEMKNDSLKENFPDLEDINLKHNKEILISDIEDLKRLIGVVFIKECELEYQLDKTANEIRIFGKNFFDINKDNCRIKYNEYSEFQPIEDLYKYKKCDETNNILKVTLFMKDNINDISGIFQNCSALIKINSIFHISSVSKINDISDLFHGCKNLTTLPDSISLWKTFMIINMSNLFYDCNKLNILPDISKWDTSNVENMMSMFNNCKTLKELPDISKWNTSKVTDMCNMFHNCLAITKFPEGICNWDISKVKKMKDIFKGCKCRPPNTNNWR